MISFFYITSRIGETTISLMSTESGDCNAKRTQSDTSLGFKAIRGFSFNHCAVISLSTKPGQIDYNKKAHTVIIKNRISKIVAPEARINIVGYLQ